MNTPTWIRHCQPVLQSPKWSHCLSDSPKLSHCACGCDDTDIVNTHSLHKTISPSHSTFKRGHTDIIPVCNMLIFPSPGRLKSIPQWHISREETSPCQNKVCPSINKLGENPRIKKEIFPQNTFLKPNHRYHLLRHTQRMKWIHKSMTSWNILTTSWMKPRCNTHDMPWHDMTPVTCTLD